MCIFLNKKWIYVLILSLLWILAAIIINPNGEFPLNDDWAYSKNVFNLSENGVLKFGDWPAMTLIAQTLWGTLFCKLFGFSFTVLRFSVLILGWIGVIAFFLFILKMTNNYILAFISSLTIGFNPLYFSLSYTFMTDVPFLATLTLSAYFYYCYFNELKIKYVIFASVFALLATMIRQLGLWIPITFIITYVITTKINLKQLLWFCFSAVLIIIIFIVYTWLLRFYKILPSNYNSIYKILYFKDVSQTFLIFWHRTFILLFYSGFFLLPVEIFILPLIWKRLDKKNRLKDIVISVVCSLPVIMHFDSIPNGNVLYNFGLGPKILKDSFYGFNFHPVLPPGMMWIFYIIGTLGAILLVFSLLSLFKDLRIKNKNTSERKIKILSLLVLIGYSGFLIKGANFFDRYFIVLIPFFIILISFINVKSYRISTIISFIFLTCFAIFSVAATHDYLSWNRAKWKGLIKLINNGISPGKIDGGIEFNGWYETGKIDTGETMNKSWWFVKDDEYVASLGNIYGYDNIGSVKFKSYLTFNEDSIVIMQRIPDKFDSSLIFCDAEQFTNDGKYFITSDIKTFLKNTETRTGEDSKSGLYSVLLNNKQPYGFTVKLKDIRSYDKIQVKAWCKNNTGQACVVITAPEQSVFYKSFTISQKGKNNWQLFECETKIPDDYSFSEIGIYIWNHGEEKAFFDDFSIILLKKSHRKRISFD
jgi:hypothetical protein